MDRNTLDHLYSWFRNYVKNYYCDDADIDYHIKLKEDHTLRVCSIIRAIGQDLELDENELCLAEAIALLHDIGRFEQYKKYRTFSDSKSVNHAQLGISILENEDILGSIDIKERNILLDAIRFHNIFEVPHDIEPRYMMFSRLIRDADKLDIFNILVKYYEEPKSYPILSIGESSLSSGCSPHVVSEILKCRSVKYTDVETSDDMKLLRLSWVFDINFRYTLESIRSKRYLQRILDVLPDTEDIKDVRRLVISYVDEKL